MRSKAILIYYFVAIVLISNGALANYLFTLVNLNVWRQCIWLFGIYLVYKYSSQFNSYLIPDIVRKHKYIFVLVLLLSIITYVDYEFNIVRIVYSWWQYFSGLPFVLFPFFLNKYGWSYRKINLLFIFLGIFQTIGLVADYFSGGYFTLTFQVRESTDGLLENGRYCFLAETPSTFGIYYCLCLVMTLRETINSDTFFKRLLYLFLSSSYVIGAWFTGSRQIVAALLIVLILGIVLIYKNDYKIRMPIIIVALLFILNSSLIINKLYADDSYGVRYSTNAIKEDERVYSWEKGFDFCLGELNIKRIFIGEAVSYVSGQKAERNEIVGFHFENSYWARMSELGLLGLWLFLLPFITIAKNIGKDNVINLLYLIFSLSFLFTSFVSPNGASTTAQMSMYIILGMFLLEKSKQNEILSF